jgi:hypothetical protein
MTILYQECLKEAENQGFKIATVRLRMAAKLTQQRYGMRIKDADFENL